MKKWKYIKVSIFLGSQVKSFVKRFLNWLMNLNKKTDRLEKANAEIENKPSFL